MVLFARCTAVLMLVSVTFLAPPARADLSNDVTDLVLGGVEEKLLNTIGRAEAAGDHLIRLLAQSALEVIQSWEKSNTALLDTLFNDLDQSSQRIFNEIDEVADRLQEGEEILMADAERLTAEWASIVKSLPLADAEPEVYSYSPKALSDIGTDQVRVRIHGPRLGNSRPSAFLDGVEKPVERPTDHDLVVVLDRSDLAFGAGNSTFSELKLTFEGEQPGFFAGLFGGKAEPFEREMSIWLLPTVAGSYVLEQSANRTSRETTTVQIPVSGRGKDSPYHVAALVPPNLLDDAWRLDQDLLVSWASGANPGWHVQGAADHGTCSGLVPGTTSPEGFTYNIQMGHVTRGFEKKDAWGSCTLTLPLFRNVTATQTLDAVTGDVLWTGDTLLDLDPSVVSWKLTTTMFDGRSYIMTPEIPTPRIDIEIRPSETQILLRPNTPRDF